MLYPIHPTQSFIRIGRHHICGLTLLCQLCRSKQKQMQYVYTLELTIFSNCGAFALHWVTRSINSRSTILIKLFYEFRNYLFLFSTFHQSIIRFNFIIDISFKFANENYYLIDFPSTLLYAQVYIIYVVLQKIRYYITYINIKIVSKVPLCAAIAQNSSRRPNARAETRIECICF